MAKITLAVLTSSLPAHERVARDGVIWAASGAEVSASEAAALLAALSKPARCRVRAHANQIRLEAETIHDSAEIEGQAFLAKDFQGFLTREMSKRQVAIEPAMRVSIKGINGDLVAELSTIFQWSREYDVPDHRMALRFGNSQASPAASLELVPGPVPMVRQVFPNAEE